MGGQESQAELRKDKNGLQVPLDSPFSETLHSEAKGPKLPETPMTSGITLKAVLKTLLKLIEEFVGRVWHLRQRTYFICDFILLCAIVRAATILTPWHHAVNSAAMAAGHQQWLILYGLPLMMTLGLQTLNMQRELAGLSFGEISVRVAIGIGLGMIAFVMMFYSATFQLVGRYIMFYSFISGTAVITLLRLVLWTTATIDIWRIVYLGRADGLRNLQRMVKEQRMPIRIAMFPDPNLRSFGEYCVKQGIHEVVVGDMNEPDLALDDAVAQCAVHQLRISKQETFVERTFERLYIPEAGEGSVWLDLQLDRKATYLRLKHWFEIAFSLIVLILVSVPLAFTVVFIRLLDGGPGLYRQTRVGRGGVPFSMLKLRTMHVDAEREGPRWADINDRRATRIGRILRRTRVDELPQLWNVVRGDMALIGPRPERPEMIGGLESTTRVYAYRHSVLPGITGWAQINMDYTASILESRRKLELDLYYIKKMSPTLDLIIIVRTAAAMLRGAR